MAIIAHALQEATPPKRVFVPRVTDYDTCAMEFGEVRNVAECQHGNGSRSPDHFGLSKFRIPEPEPDRLRALPGEERLAGAGDDDVFAPDLIIVPGVGFATSSTVGEGSVEHHRIGQGAGFYDRYLERLQKAGLGSGKCLTVGVAFDTQRLDAGDEAPEFLAAVAESAKEKDHHDVLLDHIVFADGEVV